jgi:hypothetical protein
MPGLNFIFKLFVGLSCLAAALVRAEVTSTNHLDVHDGFETPELSKLWSTDRFVSGAVTMQTNIVRAGRSAVQITVHSHDTYEAGINGNQDSERDELQEARKLTSRENVPYEFSFSMFIPTNFPIVSTRLVIAQWKQYCTSGGNCSDDSPVVAVRYVAGVLDITHQTGPHQTSLYETKENIRGRWIDFKFQIRFTRHGNGRIKTWLNGQSVVDYTGVNAYPENPATGYPSPSWFYFKMGLYRDVMSEPMTLFIDEYRKKQLPGDEL